MEISGYAAPSLVLRRQRRHESRRARRAHPVVRLLVCLVAIGLAAVLYMTQVAAVTETSARIQALKDEQRQLTRREAELRAQLGAARNPAIIDARARTMGLKPAPAGVAVVVAVSVTRGQP